MPVQDMQTDRLNRAAVYLAAAEATVQTTFPVAVLDDQRRYLLQVNGKPARVFTRRTASADRPMVLASTQNADGVHAVVFVDLSSMHVKFYVVPSEQAETRVRGEVENWANRWDLFT